MIELRIGDTATMSRYASYIMSGLVAILILQVVVFAPQSVNEGNRGGAIMPASTAEGDVEQAMQTISMVGAREGGKEWELKADEAIAFRGRNLWELKQVRAVLFAENGVEFTVTGSRGEVDTNSKNLKIEGDVTTRSSNGYTFNTESVTYSSSERTLVSPGQVMMIGPKDEEGARLRLTGQGMLADLKSSEIQINKSIRAERRVPPNRNMIIRSDGAEFSGKEKKAHFIGNVVIDMDQMRITGPEAEFEYDSTQDLIRSVNVNGGVKVSDTEKFATAQNLKVQFEDDKYVFRGNPRVVQNNDELRGEEIVFSEGGRRVKVQKAKAKVDEKSLGRFR